MDYETRDLGEAAALAVVCDQFPRLRLDGTTCWFLFSVGAGKVGEKYWSGQLEVNAKKLTTAMRELKDRLFLEMRRDGGHDGHAKSYRRP